MLCLGWLGVVNEPSQGGERAGERARGGGKFSVIAFALAFGASVSCVEVGARGRACPGVATTEMGSKGGAKKVDEMGTRGENGVCD